MAAYEIVAYLQPRASSAGASWGGHSRAGRTTALLPAGCSAASAPPCSGSSGQRENGDRSGASCSTGKTGRQPYM